MNYYLAIDIGASSGRHIVGWRENNEIKTYEAYRFQNGVKAQGGHLVWDLDELFKNVKYGIRLALEKYPTIKTLAIDAWGCDYVLISDGDCLPPCISYRDNVSREVIDGVHKKIPFNVLYEKTGIQFQPFNTVYRLYGDLLDKRLGAATDFLMIPEYLNYMLTGVKMHEYTNATTTGLVNTETNNYDKDIIKSLGFPSRLFDKPIRAATTVGMLKPDVAEEVGGQIKVVLCASHDTASAVEGIPFNSDAPYISSGTWSLFGIKTQVAIKGENSLKANYSNEGGVGYFRYQKNVMGMWVVNRLRSELCPNKPWDEITEAARESGFTEWADINDGIFLSPDSMTEAFDRMLKKKPDGYADYFNCAYVSLAHGYRQALEQLRRNTGKTFTELYIVGGGAKNNYLNELTEKICDIKVIALPIEATAIGNIKIQTKVR